MAQPFAPDAFGAGPLGSNPYAFADAQRIRDKRWLSAAQGRPEQIGILPDSGWDSYFGALQRKQEDVTGAGGKFALDGITPANTLATTPYDRETRLRSLQQPAVRGLQNAIGRKGPG